MDSISSHIFPEILWIFSFWVLCFLQALELIEVAFCSFCCGLSCGLSGCLVTPNIGPWLSEGLKRSQGWCADYWPGAWRGVTRVGLREGIFSVGIERVYAHLIQMFSARCWCPQLRPHPDSLCLHFLGTGLQTWKEAVAHQQTSWTAFPRASAQSPDFSSASTPFHPSPWSPILATGTNPLAFGGFCAGTRHSYY